MDTTIYHTILQQTRTTTELDCLVQALDMILRDIYQINQEKLSSVLTTQLRPELSRSLLDTLTEQHIASSDQESLKSFLTTLRVSLTPATIVTLTIPYQPPDDHITAFAQKTKEFFGSSTVLELNTSEKLLGGAIVIHKGNYLDLSLEHQLNSVFASHKKEFQDILMPIPTK